VGQVPLLADASEMLEIYLQFRRCWGEAVGPAAPLVLSASNNSKGDRLGYWGIYDVVKELAEIAGVKDTHPHQGQYTIATEMADRVMDPLLAMQITWHKSKRPLSAWVSVCFSVELSSCMSYLGRLGYCVLMKGASGA
jgi:integrase/recombinase XerD